jgi:DNA-binding transcriptional regulator YbjK
MSMSKRKSLKTAELPAQAVEKRRGARQERSLERRAKMAEAAIQILASHGVAGLTHRLVAAQADVSLAATTYYFDTKYDIVAEASSVTLRGYVDSFRRAAERMRAEGPNPDAFRRLAVRMVHNAAHRDRTRTVCWTEIMLDAHRHPQSLALSRQWFVELEAVWREIAKAARVRHPSQVVRSAIDSVMGLLFITIGLGLDESQVDAVLAQGQDPLEMWRVPSVPDPRGSTAPRHTRKSAETRERILSATVDTLITDGAGAVSYRSVAARAGLTAAAPFYHFLTIGALLCAAQQRLFAEAKERYRLGAAAEHGGAFDVERLIDRTATVFLREATEFSSEALASYAIWLAADRNADLRPMIWSMIADQHVAWQRVLGRLMPTQRPLDGLLAQAAFIGKLVRVLATGSATDDLALIRGELAYDLTAIIRGRFWL